MRTFRSRALAAVVAACLALPAAVAVASAAPADLDPGFSGDGIATAAASGSGGPARLALYPDGRIAVADSCLGPTTAEIFDYCIYRFNADGTPDTTFDGDGKAQTDFGLTFDTPYGVAVQPDGRIVAGGECGPNASASFCLARYNVDGSLDTSFSGDGRLTTTGFSGFPEAAKARSLLLQPDGKIVLAGFCSYLDAAFATHDDACLARFNTDGGLDTGFGGDGRVIRSLGHAFNLINDVALQADGQLVVGGGCGTGFSGAAFCLARFTAAGSADTGFGVPRTTMGTSSSFIQEVLVTGSGAIVGVGGCTNPVGTVPAFCLVRWTGAGALDTTFDGDGKLLTGVGGGGNATTGALQVDGKIVVGGGCHNPGFNDVCVARYNTNGTLDASFGNGGTVLTTVSANNDFVTSLVLAANGKIQVAGHCPTDLCLLRYLGDAVIDDTEAPEITIAFDAADTVAGTGWYNAATSGTNGVLVHVSAQDETAVTNITCTDGAATVLDTSSVSGSFVLGDGNHSISCTASDGINPPGAGSGSTSMPVDADVDQTPPTVACFSQTVLLNQAVSTLKLADVSDATSGPTIPEWLLSFPSTSTAGLRPVAIGVDDEAGNTTTTSCSYRVVYVFAGFAAPISSGSFDYVTAATGKIIPFRFTLTDANGQPVLGVTSAALSEAAGTCTGTGRTLATGDYAKGKVGLISLGNGAYELRWKAPRSDRNQCRLVSMTLPDGVARGANIRFAP